MVDAGWIRVNPYMGETQLHDHSTTSIVAVYYVNSAPKCGDLILIDPRGSSTWPELNYNKIKYSTSSSQSDIISNKRHYRIMPESDKLIIFPGNVLHYVETNKAKNFYRMTVNINLKVIR